jgi:hypothetical protein
MTPLYIARTAVTVAMRERRPMALVLELATYTHLPVTHFDDANGIEIAIYTTNRLVAKHPDSCIFFSPSFTM